MRHCRAWTCRHNCLETHLLRSSATRQVIEIGGHCVFGSSWTNGLENLRKNAGGELHGLAYVRNLCRIFPYSELFYEFAGLNQAVFGFRNQALHFRLNAPLRGKTDMLAFNRDPSRPPCTPELFGQPLCRMAQRRQSVHKNLCSLYLHARLFGVASICKEGPLAASERQHA